MFSGLSKVVLFGKASKIVNEVEINHLMAIMEVNGLLDLMTHGDVTVKEGTTEQWLLFINQMMYAVKYHSTVVAPVEGSTVLVEVKRAMRQGYAIAVKAFADGPGGTVVDIDLEMGKQVMAVKPEINGEPQL